MFNSSDSLKLQPMETTITASSSPSSSPSPLMLDPLPSSTSSCGANSVSTPSPSKKGGRSSNKILSSSSNCNKQNNTTIQQLAKNLKARLKKDKSSSSSSEKLTLAAAAVLKGAGLLDSPSVSPSPGSPRHHHSRSPAPSSPSISSSSSGQKKPNKLTLAQSLTRLLKDSTSSHTTSSSSSSSSSCSSTSHETSAGSVQEGDPQQHEPNSEESPLSSSSLPHSDLSHASSRFGGSLQNLHSSSSAISASAISRGTGGGSLSARGRKRPQSTMYDVAELENILNSNPGAAAALASVANAAHSSARLVRSFSQKLKKGIDRMGSSSNLLGLMNEGGAGGAGVGVGGGGNAGCEGIDDATLMDALLAGAVQAVKRKRSESVAEYSSAEAAAAVAAVEGLKKSKGSHIGKPKSVSLSLRGNRHKRTGSNAAELFANIQNANTKVFSISLEQVMNNLRGNNHNSPRETVNSENKEQEHVAIPVFLERMISFLETYAPGTEGIFRLSASMMEINKLREQLDAGKEIELHEQQDKHVVACLLKLWLRELPESLIPHQLYTDLRNSFGSEGSYEDDDEGQEIAESVKAVLYSPKMPALNLLILSRIIRMASLVAENSDANKMTPSNLSIVLGPNLLWLPDHHFSSLTFINKLAKLLVVNSGKIFGDSIAPGSSDALATEGSQETASIPVSTETNSVPAEEELKEKEDMSSAEISDEATLSSSSEEEEIGKDITKEEAAVVEVDMKDEAEIVVTSSSSCSSLCSSISDPEVLASNLNAISEGEIEAEAAIEDEATEVKIEQEIVVGEEEEESKKEEVVEDKESVDMTPAEL